MASQTSIVAKQVRLMEWAEQIRDCQKRPKEMDVAAWCAQHGITKANYYYRLKRVRKACWTILRIRAVRLLSKSLSHAGRVLKT